MCSRANWANLFPALNYAALCNRGLMTHLADADNPDPEQTEEQLARAFSRCSPRYRNAASRFRADSRGEQRGHHQISQSLHSLVRPGIMLYGYHTLADDRQGPGCNRSLRGRPPSRTCTHSTGQQRELQPDLHRVATDARSSATGRVCRRVQPVALESWTGVDRRTTRAGDRTSLHGYDDGRRHGRARRPSWTEAILIGQQGGERITAADLAAWQQTIPYEILCAIGPRVPRRYRPLMASTDSASRTS